MKKMIWLLFLPVAVFAQVNNPSVRYVAVAPSGPCAQAPPVQVANGTGVLYTCNNGTWSSQAGEATGPGGAHNSVQYNDAGDFGGVPTSTFGVLSSDGLGDAPTFVPPFAVDITQPPYNAQCDGSTDDHVAIQAALDNNPAITIPIPKSGTGPTECMLGTVGITLCSVNNKFGYNAIYGRGQLLGYSGSGSAITVSGACAGGSLETADRLEDFYIDSTAATGTPTMVHVDNPTVHVIIDNVDDENYTNFSLGGYTSVDIDGVSQGGNEGIAVSDYLGSGNLTIEGGSEFTCCSSVTDSQFGALQATNISVFEISSTYFDSTTVPSTIYDSYNVSLEADQFSSALTIGSIDGNSSSINANSTVFVGAVTATGTTFFNGQTLAFGYMTPPYVAGSYMGVITGAAANETGPSTQVNEKNGLELPPFYYSVAGTPLPSCTSDLAGVQLQVSDATLPTFLGTYTGGGAVQAPVLCNGTNWVTF